MLNYGNADETLGFLDLLINFFPIYANHGELKMTTHILIYIG